MNGILVVNKPKGITSRDVVNRLNKILGTKKIGHTGTLDPIATGVLVICVGRYTKLVDEITSYNKEYEATIKLGIKTDTGDVTGNIIEKKEFTLSSSIIKDVLNTFLGESIQTVPIYSAVKINGKKLYEYARNNEEVELPKRNIFISNIELIDFHDDIIKFKVNVSKGTYIRSLIEDICTKLNTVGTMEELKRTKQGLFDIKDSYLLEEVDESNFIDIEKILNYRILDIDEELYNKIINGAKVILSIKEDKVILKYNDEIIAIYQKDNDSYKPIVMLKTK